MRLTVGLALTLALLAVRPLAAQEPPPTDQNEVIARAICDPKRIAAPLRRKTESPRLRRVDVQPIDIQEAKRLFGAHDKDKSGTLKESLAAGNPVLFTVNTARVIETVGDLWVPLGDSDGEPQADSCRQFLVAIGYDDTHYDGAFEIMGGCGNARYGEAFLWVRYEDFDSLAQCAVELSGSSASGATQSEQAASSNGPTAITGQLHLELDSGSAMEARWNGHVYKLTQSYPSHTRFRLRIDGDPSSRVYALAAGADGQAARLYPPESEPAAAADPALLIPGAEQYLTLDEVAGTDYLCVLYARKPLDLSRLLTQLNAGEGELPARIGTVLARDLVKDEEVQRQPEAMSFTSTPASGTVVPVVVEIPHSP